MFSQQRQSSRVVDGSATLQLGSGRELARKTVRTGSNVISAMIGLFCRSATFKFFGILAKRLGEGTTCGC